MADLIQEIALIRQRRNPARMARRNIQIVQGEDVWLALTVWNKDTDTDPADTSGTDAWLSLFREGRDCYRQGYDYGMWHGGWGDAEVRVMGTLPGNPGRIDIVLGADVTVMLHGRYSWLLQANSQGNVSVLSRGVLDVVGAPWGASPVLVPGVGIGPGDIGDISPGIGGIGVTGPGQVEGQFDPTQFSGEFSGGSTFGIGVTAPAAVAGQFNPKQFSKQFSGGST